MLLKIRLLESIQLIVGVNGVLAWRAPVTVTPAPPKKHHPLCPEYRLSDGSDRVDDFIRLLLD